MTESPLTLPQVLAAAGQRGLELTERTFRYYAVVGLIPRPLKRPSGDEDARVHYYASDIVDRLMQIRTLQAQGYSLKQIKVWFEMRGGGTAPSAQPSGGEPRGSVPAHAQEEVAALLRFFSSDTLHGAMRMFVEATLTDGSDEALRRAALSWYETVVGGVLDTRRDDTVRQALSQLSPLEINALIEPLRRIRDEERRRDAAESEPPIVTALRALALRRARGLALTEGERARLAEYATALEKIKDRLARLPRAHRAVAPQALSGLKKSLDRLTHVTGLLESDGDVNTVLRGLARASTDLSAATSVLRGLQALVSPRETQEKT